jgi:hypothetical protein
VLLLRGKLRVELGKVVDAKADFESVLRLDAGNKDAKEALASLGG